MDEIQKREEGPIAKIRDYLANVDVKARLEDILGKRAAAFGNSIVNIVSSSNQLKEIAKNNPGSIMRAAMKAATINLPIDPALGQAAIVPYGKEAVFQIMYRGVIQLCIRSGQYKTINCSEIYADEIKSYNPITGDVKFNDPETYKMRYQDDRDKHVVGHYLYFKLLTGFEKSGYISTKEALAHAKKYSKAYQYDLSKGKRTSAWSTDPIAMGNKTIILRELKRYGIMSIEMQDALVADRETFEEAQTNASKRIQAESGSEPIDTKFEANGENAGRPAFMEDEPVAGEAEAKERKAKAESEKKKLTAAAKKAEAEIKARSKRQKKVAKNKDALPKYRCDAPGCSKPNFDLPSATDPVKGSQCPNCLSWNTHVNPQPKSEIDPDIMEENN